MTDIVEKVAQCNWDLITRDLHEKGYAVIPGWLTVKQCEELILEYDGSTAYRKTVNMKRHRFGFGEYKYYDYPLPDIVQAIRQSVYPRLAPIANLWMKVLKTGTVFPATHKELLSLCHGNAQEKPTALILKYGKGGYNTLHRDLYGDVFFPMQAALFLNEPGEEYEGGEFVLTEQVPRAQSKAIVLRPQKGDMLIFTTNFRPEKGSRGYYRVHMKHGVSEVTWGERHTLGIIFHDALN
ncbi:2OG-Fe(II) oxygenase [Sinomicrobium weinanense]|uniref:2OG-Fe(II) oxygenase n=1 Tax=Sinomicrobium weinanense TaxID=2842200 RepID=A0A926JU33_9FLAO|nr:2OG-Fe(II) oxygenase [Sinomicrobium weinanense]MBC9797211.1 2OG-Fe(II) oxygenase [Sinomicrobium weinanense]MBU3122725.1 2OG-Fe(II) oxygenase [Sinomicrobium weinanense]